MEERSLEEFLDEGEPDGGTGDEAQPGADDPAPATSTTRLVPGKAACENCDSQVSRLWNDDGTLVCRNCKVW